MKTWRIAVGLAMLAPQLAFAQDQGGGAAPAGGGGATAPSTSGVTNAPTTTTTVYPGAVAPPPPGVPIGGGNNIYSSSQPIQGDQEDHFDLNRSTGTGATIFGNPNGAADLGGGRGSFAIGDHGVPGVVPPDYTVKRGDTLWGICDTFFQNPYQWPRIWSYNPQIQNPHWIYPGDQVKLRQGGPTGTTAGAQTAAPSSHGNLIERRRRVMPQTVFLRDTGFVSDDDHEDWGEINGAAEDKMFLTDTDEAYMRIGPNHDVKLGQELSVFRPVRKVPGGDLVQIQGTVRVDRWDPSTRIARAQVIESLDVIERGARVGPIGRQFDVVPPVRNEKDVSAHVLASTYPHNFYGQNQVVFLDKGDLDGLKVGNRLFVIRRGDSWHKSLASDVAGLRIALESPSPAEVEKPPVIRDANAPLEVIGELRVLTTRKHTSAALVTASTKEIELNDSAVARKGY